MNDNKAKWLKQDAIFLNIVLTKRCHSNCRSCMFGCNPRLTRGLVLDYDYDVLEKDLRILQKFNIKEIVVLGGEVLELPNNVLLKELTLIRDCFPDISLNLLTNGYKHTDFSKIIQLGYSIVVSKYPKTVVKADNVHIFYHTDDHSPMERDTFVLSTLSRKKHENLFSECKSDCVSLFNGYVYACGMAVSIQGKNKNLGTNYPEFRVNIEDFNIDFLSRSGVLCEYCNIPKNYKDCRYIHHKCGFNVKDFIE